MRVTCSLLVGGQLYLVSQLVAVLRDTPTSSLACAPCDRSASLLRGAEVQEKAKLPRRERELSQSVTGKLEKRQEGELREGGLQLNWCGNQLGWEPLPGAHSVPQGWQGARAEGAGPDHSPSSGATS